MDIVEKISSYDPRFTHLDLSTINVSTEILYEIAEKLHKNTFINRVSWKKGSYYKIELKKKIEDKVELNFKNFHLYPTDMIHAVLSEHVYSDSEESDSVQFSLKKHADEDKMCNKELEGWRVFKVFNRPADGGYYGAAYFNDDKKQIVLAHRGTKFNVSDVFTLDSPLRTDFDGILGGKIVAQQKAAFVVAKEMMEYAKAKGFNLSFTGHSLGAWLAELSLYYAVNNFGFQSKAVTFDSPGSASTIESLGSNLISHESNCDMRNLDITTYLSAPNFVNCCDSHIGNVYRIFPNIELADTTDELGGKLASTPILKRIEPILKGLLSIVGHKMTQLVATFDVVTGKPVKLEKVLDWPRIKYRPATAKTTIATIIQETLSSVPVLKFLPSFGRWAYEVIPKPTFWILIEQADQLLSGNISTKEFWKTYEHLELNAEKGYPLKDTVSLHAEEQFALFYEGHYCTQELNLFKDVYNSKNGDWYLHQLCKLSPRKIDKKDIDDNIKQELKRLKRKYKIKSEGNKKYICVTSFDIQVDTVREEIVKLCKRYEEIKEILEDKDAYSPQVDSLYQSPTIISDLPLCTENIVERPKVLDEIGKFLSQHRRLVISAFGGTGKSTIAKEYGRSVKENFSGQIVRFIVADSSDKINDAYKSIVENELNINVSGRGAKDIMQILHCNIGNSKSSVLFIFDNVECSEDIKPYIGGLYNIENCKVIITTRNTNLSRDLNLQSYELDPFTEIEARQYIAKSSAANRFSPQEVECLIFSLSSENFDSNDQGIKHSWRNIFVNENLSDKNPGCKAGSVLPYSLSHAIAYLNQNKLCKVERYVEDLKSGDDPTGTFLLLDLLNTSELSFHVLQYSAHLDPDFISLDIFKELLSVDEVFLQVVVNKLESLSLVNLRRLESGQYGLQLHRLVQHWVKKYAVTNKHLGIVLDEQDIFKGVVRVLNKLFPMVTQVPNEDWQISQRLYLHAVKIIPKNIPCSVQVEMTELYRKMGIYCNTVSLDFSQALVHHERDLASAIQLYADQNENSNSAESTNSSFTTPRFTKKAKGPLKGALEQIPLSNLNGPEDLYDYFYLNYDKHSCGMLEHVKHANPEMAPGKCRISPLVQNRPYIADSLSYLSLTYVYSNEGAKGLKYAEEAYEMRRALYPGQDHPDIAHSLHYLGICYGILHQREKALYYGEEALKMHRSLYPGQNHPHVAASLQNLGTYYANLDAKVKGLKYREEALKMNRALYPGQNHPDVALSLSDLGVSWETLGETAEGLKYMEEALQMRRALYPGRNHPHTAASLNILATTYSRLNEREKALEYGKAALEMKQALNPGKNHRNIALSLSNLGVYYGNLNEIENAIKCEKKALDMRRALYRGQNHPDIALSLHHVSIYHGKLKETVEALKYEEEALKMRRAIFLGQNHPDVAWSLYNLSCYCAELNEIVKGLKYGEEALEMRRALYSENNHLDVASALRNVAFYYGKLNEKLKAIKYEKEALNIRQALYPTENHPDIASSLSDLGFYYGELNAISISLKYYEKALAMRRALYLGQNHPDIAVSLSALGITYSRLNEREKALKCEEEALKIRQTLYSGKNHPHIAESLHNVGIHYKELNKKEKSLKYQKEALRMRKALYPEQNHPDIASSLSNLGSFYGKLKKVRKGLKYEKEALEMRRALYPGQNHPDIASSLRNIGFYYGKLKEKANARKFEEEALAMNRSIYLR